MNQKFTIDFSRIFTNTATYFKNLTNDVRIAWIALAAGIILIVLALTL